jgi:hypothetical protein
MNHVVIAFVVSLTLLTVHTCPGAVESCAGVMVPPSASVCVWYVVWLTHTSELCVAPASNVNPTVYKDAEMVPDCAGAMLRNTSPVTSSVAPGVPVSAAP